MPSALMVYGLRDTPLNGSISVTYSGLSEMPRLELTGAQTYDFDLAWAPSEGLKGLVITFDTTDGAGAAVEDPITLTWTSNVVSKSEELSPGGAFLLCSPTPTNGITALSIVTTANAIVRVAALG